MKSSSGTSGRWWRGLWAVFAVDGSVGRDGWRFVGCTVRDCEKMEVAWVFLACLDCMSQHQASSFQPLDPRPWPSIHPSFHSI